MAGTMNKVTGYTNELVGKAKEIVGDVLGSDELSADGKVQEAKGEAQVVWGKTKAAEKRAGERDLNPHNSSKP